MRAFQQDVNMALKYSDDASRRRASGADARRRRGDRDARAEGARGSRDVHWAGRGWRGRCIPAGGGCKELLARWQTLTPEQGPFPAVRHVFEFIAVATVATSADDAMTTASCARPTPITLDRERLLADAKADALALAEAKDARRRGSQPTPPTFHLPGRGRSAGAGAGRGGPAAARQGQRA